MNPNMNELDLLIDKGFSKGIIQGAVLGTFGLIILLLMISV